MAEWKSRSAYMFIKSAPDQVEAIWKKLQGWQHTIGAWIITGDFDLLCWYDVDKPEAMQARVAEVRGWSGVQHTASHFVHQGYKNGAWWWDKPAGVWMLARENGPMNRWAEMTKWDGQVSTASTPGEWDTMSWVAGKSWDDTWDKVMEAKKWGWETKTLVPMRSWWNQKVKNTWWATAKA
jgi:hypothetical protein